MLVYDPLDLDSFRACTKWLDELAKATGATVGKDRESGKRALTGALVATKSDLSEYSKVPREQAEMLAKQHGLAFFETSALDNRDVDAPFNWLAATYEVGVDGEWEVLLLPVDAHVCSWSWVGSSRTSTARRRASTPRPRGKHRNKVSVHMTTTSVCRRT